MLKNSTIKYDDEMVSACGIHVGVLLELEEMYDENLMWKNEVTVVFPRLR